MNVLKADFISKQKRLQSRRQKIFKAFFSGYHTISNAAPTISFLKLPATNENKSCNSLEKSDRFPTSVCQVEQFEESVEPKSFGIQSSDATTSKSEVVEHFQRLLEKKDSSSSTSFEFRKLLEPFKSHHHFDFLSTSDECFEARKILPKVQVAEKNFIFQNEENIQIKRGTEGKQILSDALQQSSAFSKETFQQYNELLSLDLQNSALHMQSLIPSAFKFPCVLQDFQVNSGNPMPPQT